MEFNTDAFILFLTFVSVLSFVTAVAVHVLSKRYSRLYRLDKDYKLVDQLFMVVAIYSSLSLLIVLTSLYIV